MGGHVHVDPSALRTLARNLDSVVAELGAAQRSVLDSEVQPSAFSPVGAPLAYAFLGAIEYAGGDAWEQGDQVMSIQRRLEQTATIWDEAEAASTVREI